ncbi:TolC family protein [Persicimonas caeni]|uniref:TolC family protein n=1 Tax=Persicimonas caeni TaxID=2292766 RepID=A0A4Y6PPW8_PERCE|nr:TolC family protein [Persicimonas caeni]QDG50149.1 TolC family protein [Persicimonas caeni]QED31370.1 TolC family protein [Persicimonas caeni]
MLSRKIGVLCLFGALCVSATSASAQEASDKAEKSAEEAKKESESSAEESIEAPPNVKGMMSDEGPTTPFAELIVEGLDEHPAVTRRRAEVAIEESRLRGVGLKPDPRVELSFSNIPWNDLTLAQTPMSGIQIGVSQPLWWPGELTALREQVVAEADAREPLVDEQQVDLVIRAAGLYYQIYRIDRTIDALEKLKPPVREFLRLLRARIPTGKASVSQVERVRLQLLSIDDRIFLLMHQRPEKVARLNALLNRPAGSSVNPPDETGDDAMQQMTGKPLDNLDALVERGMQNRPIVDALERQKEAAMAGARAAEWAKYPDLQVFGAWRFRAEQDSGMDEGTDLVTLGVSSSLPFWSGERAEAAEDVAQARVVSLEAAIDAFRLELRGEIAGHLADLHHLHRHVAYYKDELIPQARQARRAALAGFQAGRADYEDWLQSEQRLVELEAKLAELRASIREHRALILALIGEVPTPSTKLEASEQEEADEEQADEDEADEDEPEEDAAEGDER